MTQRAHGVVEAATAAGLTVAAAESLTGGMVCASLVAVPGASAMLAGGVVAYQNSVKASVLGVSAELLDDVGSVDPQVALEMAAGVRSLTAADVGIATTGVAGPEPHDGRPVGSVYIGVSSAAGDNVFHYELKGDRQRIRAEATDLALDVLASVIEDLTGGRSWGVDGREEPRPERRPNTTGNKKHDAIVTGSDSGNGRNRI